MIELFLILVTEQGPGCVHDHTHSCDPKNLDFDACISQEWHCHPDEACNDRNHRNEQFCDPRLPNTGAVHGGHAECHFCCSDAQCFKDLASRPMPTTPMTLYQTHQSPLHKGHASCYTSDCGPGHNLANCSSGQWACNSDLGDHRERCVHDHALNSECCSPDLVKPPDHTPDCHYCCEDDQCVKDLLLPASTPTPTHCLVPAPNSCYTSPCRHGHDNIVTCSSGQWACKQNEKCVIDIRYDGVHMECKPDGPEQCLGINDNHCSPDLVKTPAHTPDCHYCCEDDHCIKKLITPPPAANSCYTSSCKHGDDIATCSSGQWACSPDEFCQIHTQNTGDITMTCTVSNTSTTSECTDKLLEYFCHTPGDYQQHDCHFCCPDDNCVSHVSDLQKPPSSSTTVTSHQVSTQKVSATTHEQPTSAATSQNPSTIQPTTMSQTSLQPSTQRVSVTTLTPPTTPQTSTTSSSQDSCVDSYAGDCNTDFAGRCSESDVQKICQKTCGTCGTCFSCSGLDCLLNPTKQDCQDGYCMTTVMDTTHGRDIKRECATKRQCDGILLQPTCRQIENKILGVGVTCAYCCNHPDCNEPPGLIPDAASLITHH
ncbi:hypothetical protein BaRGS_00021507 [Batillaria attramentaria]|uniref:Uncharacterized protein n=1 Tax=Batillaria attramentaria TaxID=370345 RepID=A0ABD0KJB4_9CAEN